MVNFDCTIVSIVTSYVSDRFGKNIIVTAIKKLGELMTNNFKTFIIAEVGINHNGDIRNAFKLIDVAKKAGVDAIKFQKRDIDSCYSKEELEKSRESPWGNTFRQQKEGLEFGKFEYDQIDSYCKDLDINWFASPWDEKSVDFLKQYNPIYFKIPSALLTHHDLLRKIAGLKKYTFISTGMSNLDEITKAVAIFRASECEFELMHCNSSYPMKDEEANLRCIKTLGSIFSCYVGYSGHEVGIITSVAAVAMGASSIERHITLDRSSYGSDQASSLEPQGLNKLVEYIRVVESALGDGKKVVTVQEETIKTKLRRYKDHESQRPD